MTTTITIDAHCDDKTLVEVVLQSGNYIEDYYLSNGETKQLYVYDSRQVSIREVPKDGGQ